MKRGFSQFMQFKKVFLNKKTYKMHLNLLDIAEN